ncbi:hypothetical protein [Streptosporangium canum]|uniref:hypothetical protein n=1 Tax=Streptosporangium canum TaxID=324952 RepID=UPI000B821F09|nr:hypothetical protein [Streptosporangium canum]
MGERRSAPGSRPRTAVRRVPCQEGNGAGGRPSFALPGGYRGALWRSLADTGHLVDFVGSGYNGPAGLRPARAGGAVRRLRPPVPV